jgi:hypothetical protein
MNKIFAVLIITLLNLSPAWANSGSFTAATTVYTVPPALIVNNLSGLNPDIGSANNNYSATWYANNLTSDLQNYGYIITLTASNTLQSISTTDGQEVGVPLMNAATVGAVLNSLKFYKAPGTLLPIIDVAPGGNCSLSNDTLVFNQVAGTNTCEFAVFGSDLPTTSQQFTAVISVSTSATPVNYSLTLNYTLSAPLD